MRARVLAAAVAALLSASLAPRAAAIEWPMADPSVVKTFGTVSDGRYLPGIEISSGDPAVIASAEGEVFFCEDGRSPGGLSSRLGGFIAVAHERGLVSVYSGLEEGSAVDYQKTARQGDVLGLAAKDGDGKARSRFMLFDAEKGQFVNPLLFLRPRKDERAPSIRAVFARRDSQALNMEETKSLRQGLCEIQAEFWDPRDDGQGDNAPFQVRVLLNGSERISLTWDVGREREGEFALFSGEGKSIRDFSIAPARYRLGTVQIPRGKAILEVIVSDFSQKTRTSSFAFQVE